MLILMLVGDKLLKYADFTGGYAELVTEIPTHADRAFCRYVALFWFSS